MVLTATLRVRNMTFASWLSPSMATNTSTGGPVSLLNSISMTPLAKLINCYVPTGCVATYQLGLMPNTLTAGKSYVFQVTAPPPPPIMPTEIYTL